MNGWTEVTESMPPEGEVVEVSTSETVTSYRPRLIWYNGLWWLPDKSMYVYYAPKMWRKVP